MLNNFALYVDEHQQLALVAPLAIHIQNALINTKNNCNYGDMLVIGRRHRYRKAVVDLVSYAKSGILSLFYI